MNFVLLTVFIMPVILGCIAWYVMSSFIEYKYVKACGGEMAWSVWLPFNLRLSAQCLASDNIHPFGIPEWATVMLGILTLAGIPFWWIPFVGIVASCIAWLAFIVLYVLTCAYIYSVAPDLNKHAVLYVVLYIYILFFGIAEPFILHSLRKGVEEEYE